MIGAEQHKKNKMIPTIKLVTCPACNKNRLSKYLDDEGNVTPTIVDTVDVRGEERYLDACQFCVTKYRKSDEKFVMVTMRKLSAASQTTKDDSGDSDHKDFSLN